MLSVSSLSRVSDDDLLRRLFRLVKQSRGVEAEVVAHVAEVERRRLHAREACSSMFEYCRRVLGLRENEAYLRIAVARAARAHPVLLEMLRDGRLHLSGIARLAPHLTRENADAVLKRASGMSHREVRELVAELEPRPDVPPSVRKLPERQTPRPTGASARRPDLPALALPVLGAPRVESGVLHAETGAAESLPPAAAAPLEPVRATPARPAHVEPLSPARYQVRFTASAELREKLERLHALMRSSVPDGDLARVIEIAVSEKLQRVEAKRFGRTQTPRTDASEADATPASRHIPAAVRRLVHARDGGRCAYRDGCGRRCGRRHDLEFHHGHPFAYGGGHSPGNLTLMCRSHNALLAEQDYGEEVTARFRTAPRSVAVPLGAEVARLAAQPRSLGSG